MIESRKPKIGFLGIMHGLYDEKQPEITRIQEDWAREVAATLKTMVDIDFPRAAKSRQDIESIVAEFNQREYDGILVAMLLYSPGFRLVRALEQNRLPLLLANIQPLPTVTRDWDWRRLTTNQGIHGMQDTANMVLQAGQRPLIVTENWKDPAFGRFFTDWAQAAKTAKILSRMRIAIFGRMKGMGDIVGDEGVILRTLGPETNHEGVGQVLACMEKVTAAEIRRQIEEDRRNFTVMPDVTPAMHEYAARMQIGFEKFLTDNGYDGFSANFDSFREDGRFEQIDMLAASNLMAKGYAYSNEGDVHTALLVGAGHSLAGNAHFTEMYSLDFEKDSALMSHMGEGNWKIARTDRPIKLINRELEIGGLSNPPTVIFSAQPGPATLVSLASLTGREHRFIACEGDVLDTEELVNVPMPYFHFRPCGGIRKTMDSWLLQGGTHHQVLNLGHHARRWKMLAQILGVDFVHLE
jgi:L-arabinose isomerase